MGAIDQKPTIDDQVKAGTSVVSHAVDLSHMDPQSASAVVNELVGRVPNSTVCMFGMEIPCILDSGSETSLISADFYKSNLACRCDGLGMINSFIKVYGVSNVEVPIEGYLQTVIQILGHKVEASFLVTGRLKYPIIVGCNILRKLAVEAGSATGLNLFTDSARPGEIHMSPDVSKNIVQEAKVYSSEAHVLPPRVVSVMNCYVNSQLKDGQSAIVSNLAGTGSDYVIRDGCYDILSGKVDLVIENQASHAILLPGNCLVGTVSPVQVTDKVQVQEAAEGLEVSVYSAVALDECDMAVESDSLAETEIMPHDSSVPQDDKMSCQTELQKQSLPIGVELPEMQSEQRARVVDLFNRYDQAFSKGDFDVGCCQLIPHEIRLIDKTPVSLPYRRIPPSQVEEVKAQLQHMLSQGIIRRSSSPYGSPVVLVRKKSGKLRLCVDYRRLNAKTLFDAFPLPRIEETLDALEGSCLFTSIDLAHGYYQVAMMQDSIPLTAFRVPWGLYEFLRMPQGLKTSPSTFQRIMELIFGDLNFNSLILYLDDVLIFSDSFDEHLCRLEIVLKRLIQNGLKLNGKKCSFLQKELLYLGHVVSASGVAVDPAKVQRIIDWPTPEDKEQLRSFQGLASYYRRFVPNFSKVVAPLNSLLNEPHDQLTAGKPRKQSILWTDVADSAFKQVKQLLTTAPVLIYPNFRQEFIVEVDASLQGLGACLGQVTSDGLLHPIAYASRGLRGAERRYPDYSSFKLELLALKWAIADKFCDYLLGASTIVYTDNNPLAHLNSAKLGATEQRWVAKLAPFQLEIRYRSGRSNRCADALSRCPANKNMSADAAQIAIQVASGCTCLSTMSLEVYPKDTTDTALPELETGPKPSVFPSYSRSELLKMQQLDPELREIWTRWESKWQPGEKGSDQEVSRALAGWLKEWPHIAEHDKVLYRDILDPAIGVLRQFLVPQQLRTTLLQMSHDQWGHQGSGRTLGLLKTRCFWPGMAGQVKQYVKDCAHCRLAKAPGPKPRMPMQHLLAFRPLELVAMDFLKLDRGKGGYEDVLVITDAYTKFSQAVKCPDQTALTVARVLRDSWFSCYGIPYRLHSDRGRNFESAVVSQLCQLYGVKRSRTTPYHPQGNGQTERFNQTLCGLIKSLPSEDRRKWPDMIKHLVFIYNSTPHRVTGVSPYTLMYGREPNLPIDQLLDRTSDDWGEDFIKTQAEFLQRVNSIVQQRMETAIAIDKRRYDRRAAAEPIPIGSRVLLRRCAHEGRHKLVDSCHDESFIVVAHDESGTVHSIRPAHGGNVRTVNRKLLLLDPRQHDPLPDLYDFAPGPEIKTKDNNVQSNDRDFDETSYRLVCGLEKPVASAQPGVSMDSRRSTRVNKGTHPNIHHLPKSVSSL